MVKFYLSKMYLNAIKKQRNGLQGKVSKVYKYPIKHREEVDKQSKEMLNKKL